MEEHRNPEEEAGGYGTPTVEQEMGGLAAQGNTDTAAQERDGGASGLPAEESPRDEDEEGERFDAG